MNKLEISILTLGDSNTGKSSILKRFCDDEYNQYLIPTIGLDYRIKKINYGNSKCRLQIMSIGGYHKFINIARSYYKFSDLILLIFDITDKNSFENIEFWYNDINKIKNSVKFILVGTKSDMESNRLVSNYEITDLSNKLNIPYFEVSSKTNKNIKELFNFIPTLFFPVPKSNFKFFKLKT